MFNVFNCGLCTRAQVVDAIHELDNVGTFPFEIRQEANVTTTTDPAVAAGHDCVKPDHRDASEPVTAILNNDQYSQVRMNGGVVIFY